MKLYQVVLLSIALILLGSAFDCTGNGGGQFFDVTTTITINGLNQPEASVGISGTATLPCGNSTNPQFGPVSTDSNGTYRVVTGSLPCNWVFTRFPSTLCPNGNVPSTFTSFVGFSGQDVALQCASSVRTFTASPRSINTFDAVPVSVTVSGQGLGASGTHGMPRLKFYDSTGKYLTQTTATGIGTGGTSVQGPFPSVAGGWSGNYAVVVNNIQSNGSLQAVGGASLWFFYRDPSGGGPHCGNHPC